MATIVTRAGKGSPLTNTEVDSNFVNLNTELGTLDSTKQDNLPSQTGNEGKALFTDGSVLSWQATDPVNDIFYENGKIVTADYTILGTRNVVSAGPITIADGVTVTIADNGEWTIV